MLPVAHTLPRAAMRTRTAGGRRLTVPAAAAALGVEWAALHVGTTQRSTSTAHALPQESPAGAARLRRAEEIRRHEQRMRWVRAFVVPAFTLYGLFILRPTEGHFLRYLAERRHLEPSFNAHFPPFMRGESGEKGLPAVSSRVPEEDAWVRERFRVSSPEDVERLARRRLLFAREPNYTAGVDEAGQVPVTVRSAEERRRDLQEQREHPPMHLLSEQLNRIAAASHAHRAEVGAAGGVETGAVVAPPPITIDFTDRVFFATARVVLHDPRGEPVKVMRFVGCCGMMWKQVE